MIRKINTINFDTLTLSQRLDRLQEQFARKLSYNIILTEDGKPFAPYITYQLLFAPICRHLYIVDCDTFYAYSKSDIHHYDLQDVGRGLLDRLSFIINGKLNTIDGDNYDVLQVTSNLKDTYLCMLDPYKSYTNLHLCIDWKSRVIFDVK